jgi:hypothetical protein
MRPGNDDAQRELGEVGAFQKIHLHYTKFRFCGKAREAS